MPAIPNRFVGVLQDHKPFHMRTMDSNVFLKEGQDPVPVSQPYVRAGCTYLVVCKAKETMCFLALYLPGPSIPSKYQYG